MMDTLSLPVLTTHSRRIMRGGWILAVLQAELLSSLCAKEGEIWALLEDAPRLFNKGTSCWNKLEPVGMPRLLITKSLLI